MSCVNINTEEYKNLVKGMSPKEELLARGVITNILDEQDFFPSFAEVKQRMSDLSTGSNTGTDYISFYSEVKDIVKRYFPKMNDSEIESNFKMIDKLDLIRLRDGKEVLSSFIDNVVYFSKTLKEERGEQAYKDIKHEIFHKVFNNFLNEKERENIIKSFKDYFPEFKNENDLEKLEEALADKFEEFKDSDVSNIKKTFPVIIRDFFNSIFQFFGIISKSYNNFKDLFDDLQTGKFTKDYTGDSLVTRDKSIMQTKIFKEDPDLFIQCKTYVSDLLNKLMFPTYHEFLSYNDNPQSFINTDYKSNLFRNNKELFKLALTKQEALKVIQAKIKDLKNSNIQDEGLKKIISALSKGTNFRDIYNYIQPFSVAKVLSNGELILKAESELSEREAAFLDGEREMKALNFETKDLQDPITKISEVVKDYISSIGFETTPGRFENINAGGGFINLVNLLGSLYGNSSISDNLASIKKNFLKLASYNNDDLRDFVKSIKKYEGKKIDNKNTIYYFTSLSDTKFSDIEKNLKDLGINYKVVKKINDKENRDKKILQLNFDATAQISSQSQALYERLVKLHEDLINDSLLNLDVNNVNLDDVNTIRVQLSNLGIESELNDDKLSIVIPDKMTIRNEGTNAIDNKVVFTWNRYEGKNKDNLQSYRIVQETNESNKNFVERVAKDTNLPSFIVAKVFNNSENGNQLAELTKVANSLKKISPKFFRVTSSKKLSEPDETGRRSFNYNTSFAFVNTTNTYKESKSISSIIEDKFDIRKVREDFVNTFQNYIKIKGKLNNNKEVRELLKSLLVNKLSIIRTNDFNKIRETEDYPVILSILENIIKFSPELLDEKSADTNIENFNSYDELSKNIAKLGDIISGYIKEKKTIISFNTSASNKKKYELTPPSSGWINFQNLKDYSKGVFTAKSKILGFFRNGYNNYLRYNPLFSLTSENTLKLDSNQARYSDSDFVVDFQETYFKNSVSKYTRLPITFNKESSRDWLNRNFLGAFLLPVNELLSGGSGGKSSKYFYYQQLYHPSDAPNVKLVKMGISSSEKLISNVHHMILQEAFLKHKRDSSVIGKYLNIQKHTKTSILPGLSNSDEHKSYFLDENGQNRFYDINGNLLDSIGKIEEGVFKINKDNKLMKDLTTIIFQSLHSGLERYTDLAINEKTYLIGEDLLKMSDKLENSFLSYYKMTSSEKETLRNININERTNLEELKAKKDYPQIREVLMKALSVYYLNNYVNGYFVNQIQSGMTQNYKSVLDEVKRQNGPNAMADVGLIDDKYGIPKNYNKLIVKDVKELFGQSHEFSKVPALQRFFQDRIQEIGDAQSFNLPIFMNKVRKGFGKSTNIGNVIKNKHHEIDEDGITKHAKTTELELTNRELISSRTFYKMAYVMMFSRYFDSLSEDQRAEIEPEIKRLYELEVQNNGIENTKNLDDYMAYQNYLEEAYPYMYHSLSFESAWKSSKTENSSEFRYNEDGSFDLNVHPDSVMKLDTTYFGLQQYLRHRQIDTFTSHFTQQTYLVGLNRSATAMKNSKILLNTLAKFTKAGIQNTMFDIRVSYSKNGELKVNKFSKRMFLEEMGRKLDKNGNERIISLIEDLKVSMNNPTFTKKLVQTFFNSLSKSTVQPKHPGGNFTLRADFGLTEKEILNKNELRRPKLVRDSNNNILYAEVYLPEMYSAQLRAGDMIYYNSDEYNRMAGYRIPSSDIHSGVPLKVIGYYPSDSQDNIAIIPSAVAFLHGSDYDADKIFVIRYGIFDNITKDDNNNKKLKTEKNPIEKTDEEFDLERNYKTKFYKPGSIIAQKGIKFGYRAERAIYDNDNNIKSFGDSQHTEINNLENTLLKEKEATQDRIIEIEQSIFKNNILKKDQKVLNDAALANLNKEKRGLLSHIKLLRTIQEGVYSNNMLSALIDNMSYSGENKDDMLYGISFDPIKGYSEESEFSKLAEIYSKLEETSTLSKRPELVTEIPSEDLSQIRDYAKILRIDETTEAGKKDMLRLYNEKKEAEWMSERDDYIKTQRRKVKTRMDINKVEEHADIHKETTMSSDLVGIIAAYTRGLSYIFHGTPLGENVDLRIGEKRAIKIDGKVYNNLVTSNTENKLTQELRSIALNSALDHMTEQVLNVLNVGRNTVNIFLTGLSMGIPFHQMTLLSLQPAAIELNTSSVRADKAGIQNMLNRVKSKYIEQILSERPTEFDKNGQELKKAEKLSIDQLKDVNKMLSLLDTDLTSEDLEKDIKKTFDEIINNQNSLDNEQYKKDLLNQYVILQRLKLLAEVGENVSQASKDISPIQELPYDAALLHAKLVSLNEYINIDKLFDKLKYSNSIEYNIEGFQDDLAKQTIFKNLNLAKNNNILGAIETMKFQIDTISSMFIEHSFQMKFLVKNILDTFNSSDIFASLENMEKLKTNSVSNMTNQEKYLIGEDKFNINTLFINNFISYLTTSLSIPYNNDTHVFSLSLKDQKTVAFTKKGSDTNFFFSVVNSYINSFLLKEKDFRDIKKANNYNGDSFIKSQINPEWRLKPLALIKSENYSNDLLAGISINTIDNKGNKSIEFDNQSLEDIEERAKIDRAFKDLNNLKNIYVIKNDKNEWVDLPEEDYPSTPEMGEVLFNLLKVSLYLDKFKFGSTKIINTIPPEYFNKILRSSDILNKQLFYSNLDENGNRYFKNFTNDEDKSKQESSVKYIIENLLINSIFSEPDIVPIIQDRRTKEQKENKNIESNLIFQPGMLPGNIIYDIKVSKKIIDENNQDEVNNKNTNPDETSQEQLKLENGTEEDNRVSDETKEDLQEEATKEELKKKLKENPIFIKTVFTDYDHKTPKVSNTFYILVGNNRTETESEDKVMYYYKQIYTANENSKNRILQDFNPSLLVNNYKLSEYFNPKIPSISVDMSRENSEVDTSKKNITLKDLTISRIISNPKDDLRTVENSKKYYPKEYKEIYNAEFERLRNDPNNKELNDDEVKKKIATRTGARNIIKQLDVISIHDKRNVDRLGAVRYKILNRTFSSDGKTVSLDLEKLPESQQIEFKELDKPFVPLRKTLMGKVDENFTVSTQDKIGFINSTVSMPIVSSEKYSQTQIDKYYEEALSIRNGEEIDEQIKKNEC